MDNNIYQGILTDNIIKYNFINVLLICVVETINKKQKEWRK